MDSTKILLEKLVVARIVPRSPCLRVTLLSLRTRRAEGGRTRQAILIIVQRDETRNSLFIILQVHCTCFGCQPHPSSGVHKTITAASGTGHIFSAATSLQRGQVASRRKVINID